MRVKRNPALIGGGRYCICNVRGPIRSLRLTEAHRYRLPSTVDLGWPHPATHNLHDTTVLQDAQPADAKQPPAGLGPVWRLNQ